MSKPKSAKGGVLFGTGTQQTMSSMLAASSQCDRRGLTGVVQSPEFLCKYNNVKVDLTATRQSVHSFVMFNA